MANDYYPRYRAIVPSDTVNFDGSTFSAVAAQKAIPAAGIYVGGAGIVVAIQETGEACNFTAVAGEIIPIKAIRVNSTTTTATLMVALYDTP